MPSMGPAMSLGCIDVLLCKEDTVKVEILGTGCYNCIKLDKMLHEVIKELNRDDIIISRINDESYIRKYMPLDDLPGLVINGILASIRELPDRESLRSWLQDLEVKTA
jgi:hypothetical protein